VKYILIALAGLLIAMGILSMLSPGSLIGTSTYMLMGTMFLCTGVIVYKIEGRK